MDDLRDKYMGRITGATDEATLEAVRLEAVGKKGEIALKMRELGRMTPEERQQVGPALNALKDEINSAISARKAGLEDVALDERLRSEWLDVSMPSRSRRPGSIHPVSQVMEEFFQAPYPARAAVGVKALPKGSQFEAEGVMVLGD